MNCANSAISRFNYSLLIWIFLSVAWIPGIAAQQGDESQASGQISPVQEIDEEQTDTQVFAPFVSRLELEVLEGFIRISWRDVPGVEGLQYRIYRSDEEIHAGNFDQAEYRGSVEAGVETFQDRVRENGPYFYAVVTVDPEGNELPIFIPFRNSNVMAAVVTDLDEDQLFTAIRSISAESVSGAIGVSFSSEEENLELVVLRSTDAITDSESLSHAIAIENISSGDGSYRDFVLPGIPYYYALLSQSELNGPSVELIAGVNTLATPVELPMGRNNPGPVSRVRSSQTLPVLVLNQSLSSGAMLPAREFQVPPTQPISQLTKDRINRLLEPIASREQTILEPEILPTERRAGSEKDQNYVLYQLVNESFSLGNYPLSARQLESLLTLNLSEDLEMRARYYFAQSLYFSDNPEAAFLQFLLLRDWDYQRASTWMDGILNELSRH